MSIEERALRRNQLYSFLLLSGILFGCISRLVGNAETEIRPGVKGIWRYSDAAEPSASNWQAQWIWMTDGKNSNVMLARRSFELPAKPNKALMRVTATSQYELFINGEYVCRGPARCSPHHQYFDVLDVGGLLRQGGNTIAVRVHFQHERVSYHQPSRPGLLLQLNVSADDKTFVVTSDSNWKGHPDPSWDDSSPKIARFHLEVSDRVDLQNKIEGWMASEFDDRTWQNAEVLRRETGWPQQSENDRPTALTFPWTSLIPRDIPYLEETRLKAVQLVEAITISSAQTINAIPLTNSVDPRVSRQLDGYREDGQPLILPSGDWFLLFDFGEVVNGRPRLDIEGPIGTAVDVMCAPYTLNNQFTSSVVASELTDRILLSGKRDLWEATYFKPARYLGIAIRGGEEPVRIHTAGIRRIRYPFVKKGSLRVPEAPWIEAYWEASAKTIQTCTTDAYTDNYRERRQYAQTAYYASLGNYLLFGDFALQRRYLMQVAQEQQSNGMMPAYAPPEGDDYMIILDSNCFWVRGLHNYLLYSGDRDTVNQLIPAAIKLLNLLHSYTNELGLLDNPPYPYWLDHALNDRRGANLCLNGHYLGALEDFAQVLRWLDEPGSEGFQERADRLRHSLRTHFWNPRRGLFVDALINGKRSEMFSEHANGMALAMGVASPAQAEAVAEQLTLSDRHDFIRRESGITMVTPAMSYFFHAGLCRYGYVEKSLNLFRERFDHMLQPETNGTLWEEWWLDGSGRTGKLTKTVTRSDAQTESAFPPMLFAEYLLGIRPTEPGLSEVTLFRSYSGLSVVEGDFPSPEGLLKVSWNINNAGGGEVRVDVPGNMRVRLDVNSLIGTGDGGLLINGRRLEESEIKSKSTTLSHGSHVIEF